MWRDWRGATQLGKHLIVQAQGNDSPDWESCVVDTERKGERKAVAKEQLIGLGN